MNDKCDFDWDGEYHWCPTCDTGKRMNCKKCKKDKCTNLFCHIMGGNPSIKNEKMFK